MKRLTRETRKLLGNARIAIEAAKEALAQDIEAAQEWRDNRSERWQEGDAASAYEDWLSNLETLRDEMEDWLTDVPETPEEV